jgi:hypothetical protein
MKLPTATRKAPAAPGHAYAKTLKTFTTASGVEGSFYSLPALAKRIPNVARLPHSLRVVLESAASGDEEAMQQALEELAPRGATGEGAEKQGR